jgi:hypothetical protein
VNKVFLAGSLRAAPETAYTPKGQKVVVFPLFIEDGGFTIEVMMTGDTSPADVGRKKAGARVMVSGALTRSRMKSRDTVRLRASKIFWMEE